LNWQKILKIWYWKEALSFPSDLIDPRKELPEILRDRLDVRAWELIQEELKEKKSVDEGSDVMTAYPKPPILPKKYKLAPKYWK
jgi:hypothetical protein